MPVSGPDSTGCVVLDAGYDVIKNYKMICDAGRKPVICTRKNYVARGADQRYTISRFQRD